MVRSKSEDNSGRELFHLTEQIRNETKYFDVSRRDIARRLTADGQCDLRGIHETTDTNGEPVATELRLNINRRRPPRYWSASLKMHRTRVDGIDWEPEFDAHDDTVGIGWHRHGWNPAERSAERVKIPLPRFAVGALSVDQFLLKLCDELNILLNSKDVGFPDDLFGD